MNNKDIQEELKIISDLLKKRNCTGYFIVATFEEGAGLGRYNGEDYLQLLGYVELIKHDLSLAMLEAITEVDITPEVVDEKKSLFPPLKKNKKKQII